MPETTLCAAWQKSMAGFLAAAMLYECLFSTMKDLVTALN